MAKTALAAGRILEAETEQGCLEAIAANSKFATASTTLIINKKTDEPSALQDQASEFAKFLNGYIKRNKMQFHITIDTRNLTRGKSSCANEDEFAGLCVYDPSPLKISITCGPQDAKDPRDPRSYLIAPPQIINVYKYSHKEDPQRGFFTSPHDTYTMQDGVIVGHKYASQSYVKGIFDFLTTPIRAALPQTTTSTQIQTGGGKPDTTTNTTTVVVSPGP